MVATLFLTYYESCLDSVIGCIIVLTGGGGGGTNVGADVGAVFDE